MWFADVILPLFLARPLTYRVPDGCGGRLQEGMLVTVPLSSRKTYTGVVVRVHQTPPGVDLVKELTPPSDFRVWVDSRQRVFWHWMASYYLCTEGEVMKAALPALLKPDGLQQPEADAPARTARRRTRKNAPVFPPLDEICFPALSEAQQRACGGIREAWRHHAVVLLHGVTSSGKTEIYLRLIHETLQQGRQVLYLLPEIALTHQMTARLQAVFGARVGVYHSQHTDRARMAVWQQLSDASCAERPDVILGVRSSVFLPFSRLGLVIVDEEHENTYKQHDPPPRYHARDAAIMLASLHGAKVLLGTATPSFESYYNARTGKYGLVNLTERFGQAVLPACTVLDMRGHRGIFHPGLLSRMEAVFRRGGQVMLFQNRRGYAPGLRCDVCGAVVRCSQCDVGMTYHKLTQTLECHYCGRTQPVPRLCPSCQAPALRSAGYGTERVEAEVQARFPEARVGRLDLDTARSKRASAALLADFSAGRLDVLVGTQMITKGFDFGGVQRVGGLQADQQHSNPPFRTYERGFQLMEQVAGRAGRRDVAGEVVIQTCDVLHPLLDQVRRHSFFEAYVAQMQERMQFQYPPFCRLVRFTLKHSREETVTEGAAQLASRLRTLPECVVLGPHPAPVAVIRNQHLQQLYLKIPRTVRLDAAKQRVGEMMREVNALPGLASLVILTDVDPQ